MSPWTLEERVLYKLLVAAHRQMDQQPDRYPPRRLPDDGSRWQAWKEQQCTR